MDTPEEPKPKPKLKQPPEDMEQVRHTIMRLSSMADLIGLRTYIIKRTPKGKSREPDPWAHTRAYMQMYADPANADALIELLKGAGCSNELQAVRWLLTHDELVP
jgi:hypothetical protein